MIYFIYGNQTPMIKKRVIKIVSECLGEDIDEMNYIKYDGVTETILNVVSDCNILPLGYDHKVVLYENMVTLIKGNKTKNTDEDIELLNQYILNPNPDADLIITSYGTPDEGNPIVKALRKDAKVIEVKDPTKEEWVDYVKKYTRDKLNLQIDNDAVFELAKRTNNDAASLINNADKLVLYGGNIRYEQVDLLVARPLDQNGFQLFNALINGKTGEALKIFKALKDTMPKINDLISVVANEFRTLYKVHYLASKGLKDDEIAKEIGTFDWKVKNMRKLMLTVSTTSILETLDELYELDKQTKSGDFYYENRFLLFELFILNFRLN